MLRAPRVAFRADGAPAIGRGHLARCRNLASALRDLGVSSTFVRRGPRDDMDLSGEVHWIAEESLRAGADVEEDALLTGAVLTALGADVVVVDHYALGAEWEASIGRSGTPVVVIDDLADRVHACDLLIDANPLGAGRYAGLVDPVTRLLTGPRYALIDPTLARFGATTRGTTPARMLVSLGGGSTIEALERLLPSVGDPRLRELAVDVVVGDEDAVARVQEVCARLRSPADAPIRVHGWVSDLPDLMRTADLCLGAGGISTWERMRLGLPSVVVAVAENQESTSIALGREGLIRYAGRLERLTATSVADLLVDLAGDVAARSDMARRGPEVVDGAGAERCAREVLGLLAT